MNALRMAVSILVLGQIGWAQDEQEKTEQQGDQLRYARIAVAETQPRCFASDKSPVYDDRLVEGQVVGVGPAVGEFREVILPLGVTGYVHKKFASEPEEGMVMATGSNVSFRYRPRTSEVPALMLPKGATLHFMAEQDDWWVVRCPVASAYLPEADLQLFDAGNETIEKAHAELEKTRRQEWDGAVAQRAQAAAAAALLATQREQLDGLYDAFRVEATKPVAEQSFAELSTQLDQLAAALPEDSAERARARGLSREIERQQLVAEALVVTSTEVPTRNRVAEILPPEVVDPMQRFDAVGWLRHERPLGQPARFTLMKGGKLLFEVICTSGRYDLAMLDGVEVGIVGAKSRPRAETVRSLDALKIEILKLEGS